MSEIFTLLVLICVSLLVGNEFTIGMFINPLFNRLPDVSQASAAKESAQLYGKVMPFWMIASFFLCAALTFFVAKSYSTQWWSYLAATILFGVVSVFSVIFPVPINNKIANWDPNDLPSDWRELRRRFDQYHLIRIVLLLIVFVCLIFGTISRN